MKCFALFLALFAAACTVGGQDHGGPQPDMNDGGVDGGEDGGGGEAGSGSSSLIDFTDVDGGLADVDGSSVDVDGAAGADGSTGGQALPDVPNLDTMTLDLAAAPAANQGCSDVTIDTTGLTATGWCDEEPEMAVQQQLGGPEVVVVVLKTLTLPVGRTIKVTGSRPIALVVGGDVVLDGLIDASAQAEVPGPGGNVSCSDGTAPKVSAGGGGGGGFGSRGGSTSDGTADHPDNSGQIDGEPTLNPLRGGCAGGQGGYSTGCNQAVGGGGGALQLVVAGSLSGSGELRADGGNGLLRCPGAPSYVPAGASGGGSGGAILVAAGSVGKQLKVSVRGGNGGEFATGGGQGAMSLSDVVNADCSKCSTGAGGGYGRVVVTR